MNPHLIWKNEVEDRGSWIAQIRVRGEDPHALGIFLSTPEFSARDDDSMRR